MALGGGNFLSENKTLPGAYLNFVSAANATAVLSDRGTATIPLYLDWGKPGTVIEVSAGDFLKNSVRLFGFDCAAPQMRGLRELFKNAKTAYVFRLGSGGAKAGNAFATAKFPGVRGNNLKVTVERNVDLSSSFDVSLYLDTTLVDRQTVENAASLADNDYVDWIKTAALTPAAATPLAGGTSMSAGAGDFQAYLDAVEGYSFNAIGCPSSNETVKGLFAAFTKRMREERGVKFQCVVSDFAADYEGVVNVANKAEGEEYALVYWTTGVIAGTPANKSALNKVYDGELDINVSFTQTQLEALVREGKLAFHRVGSEIRVLSDINSLVSTTAEKSEDFKQNQTIRVLDQIANDIAVLFNGKYLGTIPNDADGRVSLWSDIVRHHESLAKIRAIEDFDADNIKVERGESKRSVVVTDAVTPVNAMAQLYMTLVVE